MKIKKYNSNVVNLTEEEKKWVDEISRYFEVVRIQNLLSKGYVKFEWQQFGKLAGLFFKAALEDFKKDNPNFQQLNKKTKKLIQKKAQNQAHEFIREFMEKRL